MNTLNWSSNNLVICGDFNFDIFKFDSVSKITTVYDTTSAYLLNPLITKPTRITNRSPALIDNVFYSKPYSTITGIFTFYVSDHSPILAVFKILF